MTFEAHVITGSGRGRELRVPTLNLDLRDVPQDLPEGIYACYVHWETRNQKPATNKPGYAAAMHYGPRPVFEDSTACEVHLIDTVLETTPETVTIDVVERLREVQNFPSQEKLIEQMQRDIEQCRSILASQRHGHPSV